MTGKERETEKRDLPPTPPIESKGKEKESVFFASSACARETLPPVIDVRTPPSLELLLAFAHLRCRFFDDAFTREWFHMMNDEFMWCHPETGTPIRHWPAYFRLWRANRAFFDKLRDPNRIPDAGKGGAAATRHADNWRGTRKEDIGDVLG